MLSADLLSQFAKAVAPVEPERPTRTVTGTAKAHGDAIYVQLDGSDQLTPIASSTVGMRDGDRVTVEISNHSAKVTGNATSPSVGQSDLDEAKGDISDQITEVERLVADKVSTEELEAEKGRIDDLTADTATIKDRLTATEASIGDLEADSATISGRLDAAEAHIDQLDADMLTADAADLRYASVGDLEATNADIHNLEADYGDFKDLATDKLDAAEASIGDLTAGKLDAEQAHLLYANIDFANIGRAAIENFFSKSGMIGDLVVGDGAITGTLVGVTIRGDLIEGGTVKADKLVVQGSDGLYYKLNVSGETVAAEQTEYNSLNGSIITAKSITAEKVSVDDLVAFGATIGGYHVTTDSLYSGVKSSATNTTRGVFMNDDGEFAIGDQANYLRFFKDADGTYKLEVSASSIRLGTSSASFMTDTVEEFYSSTSRTALSGGSWSETAPAAADGRYIWRRTRVTFSDGSEEYSPSEGGVCISGDTGPQGPQGDDGKMLYGECGTASDEAAKAVTVEGFSLYTGVAVAVRFDHGNTAESPTLDVGSTGAKEIWVNGAAMTEGSYWADGALVVFVYDGQRWVVADSSALSAAESAQTSADEAHRAAETLQDAIGSVSASIEEINGTIANLVTDADGGSLMTQTPDGWRFDIGSIQAAIDSAAEGIDEVRGDLGEVDALARQAKDLADDIALKTAYITMATDDEGDPCIELGRADSEFRLRITNTSIDFMAGTSRIAYVTNRQLYITSSVVTDEMKIGASSGYVWKRRANGNMGLRWVSA